MPASDGEAWATLASPLGAITVVVDAAGMLRRVLLPGTRERGHPSGPQDPGACGPVLEQLAAYFQGRLRRFELKVVPDGTAFQRRVWALVQQIPWGETRTYGELAERLGGRGLARAVGAANAANPVPIVIPCHRVLGRDGGLTGYAGGLELKRALLAHEGVLPAREAQGVLPFA